MFLYAGEITLLVAKIVVSLTISLLCFFFQLVQIKNNDEIHNFDYKQFILDKTKKDNKAEEAINS